MQLERLRLFNYRNYASQSWKSQSNITVLTGANGAGKTNFLEAISLLTTPGRGIRSSSPGSLLGPQGKEWAVTGDLLIGSERVKVSTGVLPKTDRRIFHINGEAAKTAQQVAELVRCTWLVPGMERLANEGASMRRKFLDRLTLGQYPEHASHLNALSKTLADRNKILATRGNEGRWLDAVENTIAKESVIIASARADFITLMNETADLDLSFPQVKLQTLCEIQNRILTSSALETEDYLRDTLRKGREADKERRSACVGAHKTDVLFLDRKTGRSAVNSSSGQQKLMFLALILNYATFLKDEHGYAPLLLLDEPLVHLDKKHREILLEYLSKSNRNCFITGTDLSDFETISKQASFFEVSNGSMTAKDP